MAEEKELTGLERELVLQYLRDDNVPVTVTLEEKPEKKSAEFENEKTSIPSKEQRIPLSAVFPVAIKSQQMKVLDQGIILLGNDTKMAETFLDRQVRVQFYFNRLGLYFITKMKSYSQGLALVIPSSIKRIPDNNEGQKGGVSAELSFVSDNKSEVVIKCVPHSDYNLSASPKWGDIELEKQKEAKKLLEKIVYEARSENCDIGSGLHLLSVCRYFTENENPAASKAVEGRCEPLEIIYFDNNRILLCENSDSFTLGSDASYGLKLSFTLDSKLLLKRNISVNCRVEKIYENGSRKKCYNCRFENVLEEDERFLYERATGKKFN